MPPLHTLQLSYRPPTRYRLPNVLFILIAALIAWAFVGLVAWGVVALA